MLPSNSSADSNYPSENKDDDPSFISQLNEKVTINSKLKKISRRAEDVWMVRALDSQFQPNMTRSPVIEKLEEKRKEQYTNVLKELEESFKSVVENGNNSLRLLAETYQGELEINQNSMAQIENSVEDTSMNLTKIQTTFIQCFSKLGNLKEKRKLLIEEFEEEAKSEMNKQLNDIKKIAADSLIKMSKTSWLLQSQLQMQLENRIWEIQKVVMSNYRNYADLKLHLQLIGEEFANNVRYKLEILYDSCLTKSWRTSPIRVSPPQKLIAQMSEAHKLAYGMLNDMVTFLTKELTQMTGEFTFARSYGDPGSTPAGSMDKFSLSFKAFLINIDECGKQTILKYSSAVKDLRTGYENDLKKLDNEFPEVSSPDKTDFLKTLGHPKMEAILQKYREAEKIVRSQWRTVADEIKVSLIDTLNIFRDALEVKDRHLTRLEQAKDLLTELLCRMTDSKLDDEKALEMRINIAMDTLRQGSTEESLDKTYKEIVHLLDSMKETYEKNFIQEQEIFNEYSRIALVEVEVFKEELQAFLSKHPRNTIVDIYKIVPRRNGQDSQDNIQTDSEDHVVTSKEMRLCYMHLTGVSNWTLGLWESMNTMKSTAAMSSQLEANIWITEEKNVLGNSLNWKLQMHLSRYKRIKAEIKDVRVLEIKIHEERLRSHTTAVENKLIELKGEITGMRSKQDEIVSEMKSKITDKISKLDECKESVFAKNLVNEINEIQKETEIHLKQLYEECKAIFEHKLKWLQQSNVSFLTSIKMFSEDGNYSSEEVKSVVVAIQNVSMLIDKEEGKMLELLEQEIPDEFTSYSVDSESLKTVEKKLILKQQLERELPRLQSILRSATGAMKSEGKAISETLRKSLDLSEGEDKKLLLDEVLEKIKARQNFLLFPPATKNLEFCFDGNEEPVRLGSKDIDKKEIKKGEKESVKSDKKEIDKKKSVKSLPVVDFKDFTSLLFVYTNPNELVEQDNSFLCASKVAILKRLATIQNLHKELGEIDLSKGQERADVMLNYEKQVKKYFKEFKNYNLQCEEVWLTQIQDFLQGILVLRFQINDMIDTEINEIHDKNLKKLNVIQENYKRERMLLDEDNTIKKQTIETKLKPIVGAPANKNFLIDLIKEAGSTNCETVKNYIDCLNNFKESLRTELRDYESTFQERKLYYDEVINKCFDPDLCQNLLSNLCLIKEPNLKSSTTTEDSESSASIQDDNQDTRYMHEDIILYMAHLVSKIQEKMLQLGIKRGEMQMNSKKILMAAEFRIKPYPIEKVIDNVKKKYTNHLLNLVEEAVVENEGRLEDANAWIKNWSKNVQKVRKLYCHTS